jgi:hypothetical protein
MPDVSRLAAEAAGAERLVLPREEPHPAGMVLGALGFAVGLVAAQGSFAGREAVGWVALAMLCVAMWLHARLKRVGGGWQVDFAGRRIEPLGPAAPARDGSAQIDGSGWSIEVAPGERRAHIAIDLRHRDRGRVARLLDVPARRKAQLEAIDRLAAALARRLAVERSGPRLGED